MTKVAVFIKTIFSVIIDILKYVIMITVAVFNKVCLSIYITETLPAVRNYLACATFCAVLKGLRQRSQYYKISPSFIKNMDILKASTTVAIFYSINAVIFTTAILVTVLFIIVQTCDFHYFFYFQLPVFSHIH